MSNQKNNPIFTDLNITDNKTSNGGGVYNSNSNPVMKGGTITGNEAYSNAIDEGGHVGGIYNINSSPTINGTNCYR